jgi:hypothetical protein
VSKETANAIAQKAKIASAYAAGLVAGLFAIGEFLVPYAGSALVAMTREANRPMHESITILSAQVKDIQNREGVDAALEKIDLRLARLETDMSIIKTVTNQNTVSIESLEEDMSAGFFAVTKANAMGTSSLSLK